MGKRGFEELSNPEEVFEKLEVAFATAPSELHPEGGNEDAYLIDEENGVFAVFDGMGGRAAGKTAAELAKDSVSHSLHETRIGSLEEAVKEVETAFNRAHENILLKAKEEPEKKGMGTTASVLKVYTKGKERKAIIGNVGDSRVYKFSQGRLQQLTIDDALWGRELQDKFSNITDLSALNQQEQVFWWRRNVISQALGDEKGMVPRISIVDLQEGDELLITSDGIHDNLTESEIKQVLEKAGTPKEAVETLIHESRKRSRDADHPRAKADDMTAILINL